MYKFYATELYLKMKSQNSLLFPKLFVFQEHPYPSETDLFESYWRLVAWKAFKERTMKGVFQRRAKIKRLTNPPKTDVY